jgi:hypothetical protein
MTPSDASTVLPPKHRRSRRHFVALEDALHGARARPEALGADMETLRTVFNETFRSEWKFHQRGFRELSEPSKGLLDPRQHLIAEATASPPGPASASPAGAACSARLTASAAGPAARSTDQRPRPPNRKCRTTGLRTPSAEFRLAARTRMSWPWHWLSSRNADLASGAPRCCFRNERHGRCRHCAARPTTTRFPAFDNGECKSRPCRKPRTALLGASLAVGASSPRLRQRQVSRRATVAMDGVAGDRSLLAARTGSSARSTRRPSRGRKQGFALRLVAALQRRGSGAAVDADALAIPDEAVASGRRPGAAAGRSERASRM